MLIAPPEVRLPSRDAVENAVLELDRRLGPSKVDTSDAGRTAHARDDSAAGGRMPDAVVLAQSRNDVAVTLEVCEKHGVPVTPRAAGTGRTGGAVPVAGGVVLGAIIVVQWRKVEQAKAEAHLKEQMIERGFTADEIIRVVNAGAGRDGAGRAARRKAANDSRCPEPLAG